VNGAAIFELRSTTVIPAKGRVSLLIRTLE
jgi:hypothetical protein